VSLILNIDTAVAAASICLADGENCIGFKINPEPKESATWIQVAIKALMEEQNIPLSALKAIAVSSGPGSYTGLRVGMATAKGLCYALKIPLISLNTLQIMSSAAVDEPTELLCPMIDARRMEVFTAIYNKQLQEVVHFQPVILQPDSFADILNKKPVTFFGNGSEKFKNLTTSPNAFFQSIEISANNMSRLAFQHYKAENFADLAYSEPFYGKEFYNNVASKS
jgi:tRNA threonylcarbamoyladenosine biosynthesis protein TsaB